MSRILNLVAPLALMGLVAAAPAAAQTDIGNMTPEERAAFGAEVRAYLLANPEVLTEIVDELTRRREEAQAAADGQLIAEHAEELYEDDYSYVMGNPEGDVTVVEFLDYNCTYCRQAATASGPIPRCCSFSSRTRTSGWWSRSSRSSARARSRPRRSRWRRSSRIRSCSPRSTRR